MNDLTEQWKKGELPEGWYYIKVDNKLANNPVITECVSDYNLSGKFIPDFYEYDDDKIVKVLAPVPSYDEWKEYQELDKNNKRNTQLAILFSLRVDTFKELLKECREPLEVLAEKRDACEWNPEDLLAKIDEVLK